MLAIYPDNDSAQWAAHAPYVPPRWINGYDRDLTIMPADGFLFRSLPALYVLDESKRFLLTEATADEVERVLTLFAN